MYFKNKTNLYYSNKKISTDRQKLLCWLPFYVMHPVRYRIIVRIPGPVLFIYLLKTACY